MVLTPRALKRQAYSEPTTPPPITTIDLGKLLHLQHGGGIENIVVVELNILRPHRSRAGGDENDPSVDLFHRAVGTGDLDRVGIDDAGDAGHAGDVVPGGGEVAGGALLFAALDEVLTIH